MLLFYQPTGSAGWHRPCDKPRPGHPVRRAGTEHAVTLRFESQVSGWAAAGEGNDGARTGSGAGDDESEDNMF